MFLTSVEWGLIASIAIIGALVVRLTVSPKMRESLRVRTPAEYEADIASLRETVNTLSEVNGQLRTQLALAQRSEQDALVQLAALRGEMGRTR